MLLHYALLWKGERSTFREITTENTECTCPFWLVESHNGQKNKFETKCATEVQMYL